jgi:clan AA aspartic protease (TIGR02281 family)
MALDERDYMKRRNADDPYYRPKEFRGNRNRNSDGGGIDWDMPVLGMRLQTAVIIIAILCAIFILNKNDRLERLVWLLVNGRPSQTAQVQTFPAQQPVISQPVPAVQQPVVSNLPKKIVFYGQQHVTRSPDGHFYLPGKINGTPVTFMIDTGATVTFISNNMAIGAGITECTKQRFVTAMGEDPDACVGKIERLDFGTFTMHDMDVGISKNLPGNPLLGMNVLKQLKMVQSGDTLILENNP